MVRSLYLYIYYWKKKKLTGNNCGSGNNQFFYVPKYYEHLGMTYYDHDFSNLNKKTIHIRNNGTHSRRRRICLDHIKLNIVLYGIIEWANPPIINVLNLNRY